MSNIGYGRMLTRPNIEFLEMSNIEAKGVFIVRHCERSAAISNFLGYGQPEIASRCSRRLELGDKETVLFRAPGKP